MLYTPATMALWPRLIFAANLLDPAMAEALRRLSEQGADLTLKDSAKTGGKVFALSRGALTEEQYRQAVGTPGEPRYPFLGKAVARARTTPHPWLTAVQMAYQSLDDHCKAQAQEMAAGGPQRFLELAPNLLDRHLEAVLVARTLWDSGIESPYKNAVTTHAAEVEALRSVAVKAGLRYDVETRTVVCQIQTPDGPIRLVSVGTNQSDAEGAREPGATVLTAMQLSEILAPLDAETVQRKEAG